MANRDVQLTLQDGVSEVLTLLTGLNLEYLPEQDRFQSVGRALNRAVRQVALETDWSVYASEEDVGLVEPGTTVVEISGNLRPRVTQDDAIRLVNEDGFPVRWAYYLPRDALHKYATREGLWVATTRTTLRFSRPFFDSEAGLHIVVSCMREPRQFDIPPIGTAVPTRVLKQPIDFDFPDLVVMRAAYLYAQSDPVMQPRVPTLEAQYKDAMYQLVERDTNFTDSPYQNEFILPMQGEPGVMGAPSTHMHPHSDTGWMH